MKKGLRRIVVRVPAANVDSNRRPDEEGIKTTMDVLVLALEHSNRRPDEEGIKTSIPYLAVMTLGIPTADLMKKGLRPPAPAATTAPSIPTADLMKKGLRHPLPQLLRDGSDSNRRPDEEGIKTPVPAHRRRDGDSNRRPDEEGIKTQLLRHPDPGGRIPTADLMKKGLRHMRTTRGLRRVEFQPQT